MDTDSELIAKLNEMSPEEAQAFIDSRPDLDILRPAESFMGKPEDFSREFVDLFERVGPWYEGTTDIYHSKVESGQYLFEHFLEDASQAMFVPLAVSDGSNWGWEARIQHMTSSETAEFGIVFGCDELAFASYLIVNVHKKYFSVAETVSNDCTFFAKEKSSFAVESDVNVLRAECLNGKMQYSINNYYLGSHPFRRLHGNKFGIVILGKARITVDRVKIQW